MDKFRIS